MVLGTASKLLLVIYYWQMSSTHVSINSLWIWGCWSLLHPQPLHNSLSAMGQRHAFRVHDHQHYRDILDRWANLV